MREALAIYAMGFFPGSVLKNPPDLKPFFVGFLVEKLFRREK